MSKVSDVRYGRQGGQFVPPAAPVTPAPTPAKSEGTCSVCGLARGAHSGRVCPPCGMPVEHHDAERTAACWEGRARMAAARRAAGLPLDAVDVEAIAR